MLSRRKFLAIGAAGMLAAGLGASLPSVRHRLARLVSARHVPGPESDAPIEPGLSETVTSFIGTLFGQELSKQDHHEISQLVSYAASVDSGWIPEYRWLASHVDHLAMEAGANHFSSARPALRESITHDIVSQPADGLLFKLFAAASEQRAFRIRMQVSTIPHLRRIYLASGAPWRKRGYQSWPGVPGDPREYTRPGPVIPC